MSIASRKPDAQGFDNISASRYISHVGKNLDKSIISARYIGEKGVLFKADCLDLLASIQTNSVDVVFADPPFNLGKRYEDERVNDNFHDEMYRGWCRTWILESIRVLKPGGALFIYHIPMWLMDLGAWLNGVHGVDYRAWIAMKMKNGFPIRGRIHPAHYGMLYFTKSGAKPTFNVVRTKAPTCRKCNALQRDYGGYRAKYAKYEDEEGIPWIQISDFWEDTRPATQDKARENGINELPLHVPERAIQLASNEGDVVLDVFSGSGSTIHAAQRNNRNWIGGDLSDSKPALARIASFWGTQEANIIPKALHPCFSNPFRDSIVGSRPRRRPIRTVPVTEKDETATKYAPKSKVIRDVRAIEAVTQPVPVSSNVTP
jgi:site-specific DNA-methyltransferase (adenine-specific)